MTASENKLVVLAVDDTPENLDVVKGLLVPQYIVKAAINGMMALKIAGDKKRIARCVPLVKESIELLEAGDRQGDAARLIGSALIAGGYPPELAALILRLLSKNPEDRHANAAELAAELSAFLDASMADSSARKSLGGIGSRNESHAPPAG